MLHGPASIHSSGSHMTRNIKVTMEFYILVLQRIHGKEAKILPYTAV